MDCLTEGIVQIVNTVNNLKSIRIFKNNEWNYLCGGQGSNWDANAAQVACRQTSGEGSLVSFGTTTEISGGTRLRSLTCTGTETDLGRCGISLSSRNACPEYATINCVAAADTGRLLHFTDS